MISLHCLLRCLLRRSLLFILLLYAGMAGAIDIYKYQLSDGSILYSQQRVSNGKLLTLLRIAAPTPAQIAEGKATQRSVQQQALRADQLTAQRALAQAHAQAEWRSAVQTLACVRPALSAGITPLPGERTGIVGGYSRLNDTYWARQHALQNDSDSDFARALEQQANGALLALQ